MWLTGAMLGLLALLAAAADPASDQKETNPPIVNVHDLDDDARDALVEKWKGPKVEHEIQVLTKSREPLAGATVRVNSIVPLTRTTDVEGRFRVTVPYVANFGEALMSIFDGGLVDHDHISPILNVGFDIDHPNYPVTKCRIESRLRKQEFIIEDGGRLQLMACLAEDPAPVHGLIPQFNSGQGIRWSEEDGLLSVRRIDMRKSSETRLLRIVHVPDSGPAWFSDVVDPRQLAKDNIPRTLTLKRGFDLDGQISENVPRPIQNGWVAGLVIKEEEWKSLQWMVTAPIAADGTFTLSSLPQGELVQIVAVCDGWVSRFQSTPEAEREGYKRTNNRQAAVPSGGFAQSRFHRMVSGQLLQVPMERTHSFEIEVVDTENRPLPGVTFFCNPHYSFEGWGSSHLDPPGSMIDYIRRLNGEADPPPPTPRPSRFPLKVVSDENGIARFDGIPCPMTSDDEPLPVMLQFDSSRHMIPGSLINPVNFDDALLYADISAAKVLRKKVRLTPARERVADQRP